MKNYLQITLAVMGFAIIALIIILLYPSVQPETVAELILFGNREPFKLVDNSTLNSGFSPDVILQGVKEIGMGTYNANGAFAAYVQITKFNNQENAKKYFSKRVAFWREKTQQYDQISSSQFKNNNKLVLQGITKGINSSTYEYVWRDRIFIYEVSGKKLDINYPLELSKLFLEGSK